jgi:osmotically-inducible protein OsmY
MKANDELKNRVKGALAGIDGLAQYLSEIHTLVSDGVVTLSGRVDTVERKNYITDVVVKLQGVKKVINALNVAPVDKHRFGVDIDWTEGDLNLR